MSIMLYIYLRCDLIYKYYQSELIDVQDSLVMLGMMTIYTIYLYRITSKNWAFFWKVKKNI